MRTDNSKTVFVGLSGGVDSSVAALRLKNQGYNVVGVFIKVWHPDFIDCNWEQERLDAMRVAAHLDIPFLMCDAEESYKQEVADYFISEYQAGRTPNPDVMCNKAVKFGAFMRFAKDHGADYIATGHYVQKQRVESLKSKANKYELLRGLDDNKDQSYFLWTLTQEQLAKSLFPVGDTPKEQIREEAEKAGIPVSTKKDSQGICFLGHIDIPDFLSHFIELKQGDVLNEAGEVIGQHDGALVYTNGQRHGFSITKADTARSPHYVINRDIKANTLTVSQTQPTSHVSAKLRLESINWISRPEIGQLIQAQTRYRQTPIDVSIKEIDNDNVTLEISSEHEITSAGQSCVLYDGARCLGGGIIV